MFYVITILVIIIDQITKYIVVNNIGLYQDIPIISGFFNLTHVTNKGAAWSMLEGQTVFLIVFPILMSIFIFLLYLKNMKTPFVYPLAMILGGAIGNLIDRTTNPSGVIDFIELHFGDYIFPVFNLADSFIVCGGIIFAILFLINDNLDYKIFSLRRRK